MTQQVDNFADTVSKVETSFNFPQITLLIIFWYGILLVFIYLLTSST